MALWIHSLLCLIPAPIDRHAVFAPANKQHDKGWAWWWKAVELYICFLMGYFQNFSFLPPSHQSNPPVSALLSPFSTSFWAFSVCFWETFHQRSVQLLHSSCFYIPQPVSHREWCWGVCHHLLCSERRFDGVLAYAVFVCTIVEVSEGHVMLGWVTVEEIGLDGQIIVLRFRVKED